MACHTDVMRYACQHCDKSFRHSSVFKTHQRLHTGARPYVCHVCSKDFANWSNCNKHMLRKHGATLAKTVLTPQGKVPINPKTGKPKQFHDPELVKDWSEQILRKRERKK
ncbi:uncharacterized protein [Choristoneura fumiferana]|uniref:uncharacterized protein n=1 Tax=Choristoneura fumiferana TaxID=7141 RepID=UPI003D15EC9C